jgi:hypothetical protein
MGTLTPGDKLKNESGAWLEKVACGRLFPVPVWSYSNEMLHDVDAQKLEIADVSTSPDGRLPMFNVELSDALSIWNNGPS